MRTSILLLSSIFLLSCDEVCEDADSDGQGDTETCIEAGEEGFQDLFEAGGVFNNWDCDDSDATLITWFPDTDYDGLGETGHDCAEPVCDTYPPSTWSCVTGRPAWVDNARDSSF